MTSYTSLTPLHTSEVPRIPYLPQTPYPSIHTPFKPRGQPIASPPSFNTGACACAGLIPLTRQQPRFRFPVWRSRRRNLCARGPRRAASSPSRRLRASVASRPIQLVCFFREDPAAAPLRALPRAGDALLGGRSCASGGRAGWRWKRRSRWWGRWGPTRCICASCWPCSCR